MAATQTEIISERRKEKKRAKARGEGDMVEGYDPVVPPPPNVAPPLPPEAEGYDPVVDPPRPVYKGFKSPPGMTADQRQRWQQAVDTRLSGKEDRALERGKQDTKDLLSGIGEQAGKVYGDLDEMSTKALQYPVKFSRDPMGESEKLSGMAIEMGKGLAQTAAAPLELSADITAGRTTPRAVEKQASDTAKRYARALASGDIEDRIKATQELSAATSFADPGPGSDLVYAGASFADGDVKNGMAGLLAALAAGGLSAYTINNVKKSLTKDMTDKGMDAANAEKVADRAVDKAEEALKSSTKESVDEAAAAWHHRKSQLVLEDKPLHQRKAWKQIEERAPETAAIRREADSLITEASQLIDETSGKTRLGPPVFKLNEAGNPAVFWHWDEVDEIIELHRQQGNIEKAERLTELRDKLSAVSGNPDLFEKLRSDIPSNVAVQAEVDAAVGQRISAEQTAKAEAKAAKQAELARLEADAQAQFKAREDAKKGVSDEPTVREPLVEDTSDMPTSPTPVSQTKNRRAKAQADRLKQRQEDIRRGLIERRKLDWQNRTKQPTPATGPEAEKLARRESEINQQLKDDDGTWQTELRQDLEQVQADQRDLNKAKAPEAPEAPKAEKPPTSEAPDLSKKTIKQLKAHAKSEGISLSGARTKAAIINRIEKPGAGSAIAKARKEAQQPPKAKKAKKAKKPDPEPDPAGKPPGGGEFGPAPKTRKVKVRTRGRDAPDDIERSGDVSKTATFVETEPVRGARTSVPLKVRSSNLTKSMSRYSDPKNQTTFVGRQAIADHATNLANQLEKLSEKDIRNSFDQIRRDLGVSRVGEGTGPTTAVVGGKKTALSGPGKILSTTGELGRRRGVKTKARVAERNLVAVETAFNEMAESAGIVKKSQAELDDVMKTMGVPGEEGIKPHVRLLEEYESKVKKYEELSGAFAKKFL